MNTLIANLSAKKTNPARCTNAEVVDDEFDRAYREILTKYGRTESEMVDWMENLSAHINTLQNAIDITEDKIAVGY